MKEKTQYTELDRFYIHAPFVQRVRNRQKQMRACIAMAIGIILTVIPPATHMASDFMAMLTMTLGVFVFLGALVQCAKGSVRLVYTPTGSVLHLGTSSYDHACCPMLRSLLEEGACEDLEPGSMPANPNGGIKVEYILSEDHMMLAINVKRFENLMWLPFSDNVFLFTGQEAEHAINQLGIDCQN